jgi:hypothetical protein
MKFTYLLIFIVGLSACGKHPPFEADRSYEECGHEIFVKGDHHYVMEDISGSVYSSKYFPQTLNPGKAIPQADGTYLLTWGGYGSSTCSFAIFDD